MIQISDILTKNNSAICLNNDYNLAIFLIGKSAGKENATVGKVTATFIILLSLMIAEYPVLRNNAFSLHK